MIETKVRGEYKFTARRADGTVRDETDWIPNLITDNGLDGLASGRSNLFTNCCVGLGNTPPANSDTALVTFDQNIGTSTPATVNSGSPNYILQFSYTFLFATQVTSRNYAEVGVGAATNGTNLFSRALIVDSGGAPTTFTVLVGEQLEVVYRLNVHQAIVDSVSTVVISGVTHTVTARAADAATAQGHEIRSGVRYSDALRVYSGGMSAITGTPGGTSNSSSTPVPAAYVTGTFYRDVVYPFSTTAGNVGAGGIAACAWVPQSNNGFGLWWNQVGISPPILKDATKTLSLTVRHSWARIP